MPEYSDLSILIVDPSQGMRASLHNMLTQLSITHIDHAVNSGTAIRQLDKKSYDVILCEYDLGAGGNDGGGQDGQQLLEDLRHHKLIGQWTIFIMITSEGVYSKVMGAAELTPTDYILKPFTVDVLSQRIARAVDRRATFLPIYQLIGQGRSAEAVDACVAASAAQPRYGADYQRLRAELLLSLDRPADAEQVYRALLENRDAGWMQLGVANALFQQQRYDDAGAALAALIAASPKLMAAYDLLARTHRALDQLDQARQVLEDAVAISPNMVRRLRLLGDVAYASGDTAGAERAYKQVVAKSKYSEFRDPEDHLNLVKALVKKGDAVQMSAVIRDLDRSLRGTPAAAACRAYASAMLHALTGKTEAAAAELRAAVAASAEAQDLSAAMRLSMFEACLEQRLDAQAATLLTALTADPASGVTAADGARLYRQAGREDLVPMPDERIERLVDELVKQAAIKASQGDLRAAVLIMNQALLKRPDNPGLWAAALTPMLRLLGEGAWDEALAGRCAALLARMRGAGGHPLLAALGAQYDALRAHYPISDTA
ncbi:response regulator [Rugamonas sp.]|uniref:response regulator n=1 Tax=Rugamonas sp. TaxID=1926287 RepID=UPI0025F13154|nr:response regulator [Rugamonas sp.]